MAFDPNKIKKVAPSLLGKEPSLGAPLFEPPSFSGEAGTSFLPEEMRHLVFVTGHRGTGKTTFALGSDDPNNILMLDFESKGEGFARPLGIGGYFPILDDCLSAYGFDYSLIQVYQRTRQILEAVPEGRFTTLILDNGGILQDGCAAEVKRAPLAYGVDPEKAATGSYGGPWPGVKVVLRTLFHLARSKGIKLIVVTFQPTTAWKDGRPLFNKFKTTDVAIWHEMSILTLVLVKGLSKFIPAPSALVIKEQLAALSWDPEKGCLEVKRRLPLKLPLATMGEVARYLKEPADLRFPKEGETPLEGEVDQWSPTFSKDQLKLIEKLAELAIKEEGGGTEE